ncbi:hypothetical protein A3742_02270 [Oleiphilus sp. HI0071]|nr:hypothetical protein A3737_06060 [Oleiphilus sp. HI0065]KZY79697.1 hypothetical protein A3742_02270 [Oleiphilus sp. HI0071]KZY89760.1 hypothetical protein A3744_06310 [Oleiphilus sp. HI0073]KZZ16754.1 hypothetical protein A3751_13885 [Oleiphilus sp. HI0080]KZZ55803.1 hypothetical protein A3760_00380 [Oleiphilus sp. HI0122]
MSLKHLIKNALHSVGIDISRVSENKPPPVLDDLRETIHKQNIGRPSAHNTPINKCRTVSGLSFGDFGWHPFVELTKQLKRNENTSYRDSILKQYYTAWTPSNSYDALLGTKAPLYLKEYPAYTLHHPLQNLSPDEREAFMRINIKDENMWSANSDITENEGYGLQGPVSERKGEIEFNRVRKLYLNINRNGYRRNHNDGDITAIAVLHKGEERFLISHGQHRAAVAAGLGFSHVPMKIISVYDTQHVEHWPQVFTNFWSPEETLSYVEHLYSFNARAWARSLRLASK